MSTSAVEPQRFVPEVADGAAVRPALVTSAGGSLRNVIRTPRITCRVCAAPVDGFDHCWRCRQAQRIAGVADVVAPLTYAITGTGSAALVRDYKNHPARAVRERCSEIIKWLVLLGITHHERCIAAAVGSPVARRVVIPSLTSRPGVHPFTEIARAVGAVGQATLMSAPSALCDRTVRTDKFQLAPGARVDGRHVLVLDDIWTTGSNAESAALALRRAGAAKISVMVVGRWLSPGHRSTAEFIDARLQRDYDPDICPVTGDRCP
jgi:hypothetical protein